MKTHMVGKIVFGICCLVSSWVFASECPQFYPDQKEIIVPDTIELCNSFYVVRYSLEYKGPVLTAHWIYPDSPKIPRVNRFHQDTRLPNGPTPGDYHLSGYDKGHMVPAGDSRSAIDMDQSYLMTNMTPQVPSLNRLEWKYLESKLRGMVTEYPISVVTIAEYKSPDRLLKGEFIPSGYWKVVFLRDRTEYYYAPNIVDGKVVNVTEVTLHEIMRLGPTE